RSLFSWMVPPGAAHGLGAVTIAEFRSLFSWMVPPGPYDNARNHARLAAFRSLFSWMVPPGLISVLTSFLLDTSSLISSGCSCRCDPRSEPRGGGTGAVRRNFHYYQPLRH